MNTLFAAVRAIHYASAMLLLGELVFALAVAGPATRAAGLGGDDIHRRLVLIARWSVVAGIASGLAWFVIGAAVMNGTSVGQAIHWSVLELVLSDTKFGRVWLRFTLLAAYCVMLQVLRSSPSGSHRSRMIIGMLVIAAAYLGALAWTGHAAAGQGRDGDVEIASDVVHLLAAGTWLGALPALVHMLRRQALGVAARATRRFSTLGAIAVTLVTASGLANAWYLVGYVPALIGTDYGRLLLAKLALFAAMLVLAMANRWHLSIRLPSEDRGALRLLRRNAILEIAAGIGVVTIVGALGVTVPAAHQVPVWPFEHTLSLKPVAGTSLATGDSGSGRRHRPHVGRHRSRGLSPGTHWCPLGAARRPPEGEQFGAWDGPARSCANGLRVSRVSRRPSRYWPGCLPYRPTPRPMRRHRNPTRRRASAIRRQPSRRQ